VDLQFLSERAPSPAQSPREPWVRQQVLDTAMVASPNTRRAAKVQAKKLQPSARKLETRLGRH